MKALCVFRALASFQEALKIQKHDATYIQMGKLHALTVRRLLRFVSCGNDQPRSSVARGTQQVPPA